MRFILIALLLLCHVAATAQLTIGDQVPAINMPLVINYKNKSANLADFRDKLLIIDCWATTCSGCVAALPKLHALQAKYGDKVTILPVTTEEEALVTNFLKKNRHTRELTITSVVADTVISTLFPHAFIPHEIWVYKGKVAAITLPDYVTEENINLILSGRTNNWLVKNDFTTAVNYNKPFLAIDTLQYSDKTGPLTYTAIFGYRPGAYSKQGTGYDTSTHTIRTWFTNFSIAYAYYYNLNIIHDTSGKTFLPLPEPTRIVLEVKDKTRFLGMEESGDFLDVHHYKTSFCYESRHQYTGQNKQEQSRTVLRDLDYLLGIHGRFEQRKVKCLSLVRNSKDDKIKTSGGATKIVLKGPEKQLRNAPLHTIVEMINSYTGNPPVFDATGYTENVDMDFHLDSWNNITAIRQALHVYGLDLAEEERDLLMLVFSEN